MSKLTQNFIPVKRETKAQVFARFGIQYKSGKIYAPRFGFIPLLLVNGNKKIGRGVYHFSMLPTCRDFEIVMPDGEKIIVKGTCNCDCPGCYATTGNYRFMSVKRALAVRTILVREYLDFVRRAIIAQIVAENIKTVRIHAAGDFDNPDYIATWRGIVEMFPDTVFWTYTKRADAEDAFKGLKNGNVVKSLVPGCGKNYGTCEHILNTIQALKDRGENSFYVCRCGVDNNQHCANCTHCARCKYVLFIEHGTDYKAESDPLFPTLKSYILAQAD